MRGVEEEGLEEKKATKEEKATKKEKSTKKEEEEEKAPKELEEERESTIIQYRRRRRSHIERRSLASPIYFHKK
ncbi:hypothetical protein WAI453_002359 [Rhynchosporium graminicola]